MGTDVFAVLDPGWLLLLGTGVVAGVINGVVGSGTLISFPVLLLLGYPPLVANVSNNIGLLPGSVAAVYQYRTALARERSLLVQTIPLAAGGSLVGAVLLIALPGSVFATVVPVLIAVALLLVAAQPLVQPRIPTDDPVVSGVLPWSPDRPQGRWGREAPGERGGRVRPWVMVVLGLLGVYGGYFGAAQGIMLIVTFALAFGLPFSRANGFKNTMAGVASLVAALVFVVLGRHNVDWVAVGLLAIVLVGLVALWATLAW